MNNTALVEQLGFELKEERGVWLLVDDLGEYREATLNERVLWDALTAAKEALHGGGVEDGLTTCNCRWNGVDQVQSCELHEAHVDAIHEWAERAKTAERALLSASPTTPAQPEPKPSSALTDKELADPEYMRAYIDELYETVKPAQPVNQVLLEAFKDARETLQRANDQQGCSPICDTIWHTPYETLFDFMDAAIAQATQPGAGLTDGEIEALAKPFVRALGGDHWSKGEDGIPDNGRIEDFARAIEAAIRAMKDSI